MSPAPVMQVIDARLSLGGRRILDGIDLELHAGEVVALVGPNGAGKSSLLAAISGDEPLDAGRILLHGTELGQWGIGRLAKLRAVQTQESRVSFAFTGQDVVRMGRAPWAGSPEEERDDAIVATALESAEAEALAGRTVQTLSGGEKARVSFARALAQETALLLLDEPTAPLDIRHQEQLMTTVRRRAAEGATAVVVLHDLSLAAAYADRIALLDQGRLTAIGEPAHVLTARNLQEVYRYPVTVTHDPASGALLITPLRSHLARPRLPEGELI